MNTFFRGSALALALASATLAAGCVVDRDGDRHHMSRGDHDSGAVVVAFDFGTVRYGYDDGYWDNGHQWHRWNNDSDMQAYRDRQGTAYHAWHHDRDSNNGWEHD